MSGSTPQNDADVPPPCHPERSEGSDPDVSGGPDVSGATDKPGLPVPGAPEPSPGATDKLGLSVPEGREVSPYADDLYCPECGYSLRGLTSNRCPECGLLLDFIESETSLIPWERRRELGRFRAYWQTVWMVMFRNKVLCRAAYGPVGYRDCQSFRWLTIVHAYLTILLILPTLEIVYRGLWADLVADAGAWLVVLVHGCGLLSLIAMTGLPSYLFHPRFLSVAQQDRALALSYYGSAALALTPLATLLGLGAAFFASVPRADGDVLLGVLRLLLVISVVILCVGLWRAGRRFLQRPVIGLLLAPVALVTFCAALVAIDSQADVGVAIGLLAAFLPAGLLLLYWLDLISIARRTMRRSWTTLRVAVLVPVLWIVVAGAILVGLPAVAYVVAILFHGLFGGGLSG